jgi:hypothetical protein
MCSSGVCIDEPVSPPPGAAPSDGDYDHVVTLTGTQTGSSVASTLKNMGSGTILVRPANQNGATITGGMAVPRADVTFYGLNLQGDYRMAHGTVFWGVYASPAVFSTGSADNWIIRDSEWSGGQGSTREQNCVGNVYSQNLFNGGPTDPTENWLIENSVFRNYMDREGSTCQIDHSEAFYIGGGSKNGTIRNNDFINNGSTGHIFFTWFGGGCGSPSDACYPDDICLEGNTFTLVYNDYYDIQARIEIPLTQSIHIDPAQDLDMPGNFADSWMHRCP